MKRRLAAAAAARSGGFGRAFAGRLPQERLYMKKPFMERVAAFIVDRRYLFVVLFVALCIFSIFTSTVWTSTRT